QRLARAVEMIDVDPPRQLSVAVADRRALLPRAVVRVGLVELERLRHVADLGVRLELARHPRHVVDDGADRVAWIRSRERPVHDVDAGDILRSEHPPDWRARNTPHT